MNKDKPILPIFFCVDDQYIPFLAVTLRSLIDNSSSIYNYVIKILYVNISENSKKKIKKYEKENINIEFVDLKYYIDKIKDKLYVRDYYTKTTYFRLFIPELYPQYKKAIYLDCDMVILKDIAELYNIDIGDNLVGAVPDGVMQQIKIFQNYAEKVIGVSNYNNYFNAGMLIMNLDEMRRYKYQEKFTYLLETTKYAVAQDQDYLNRICKGRVKIIDKSWNTMPINCDAVPESNIKIIHFNLDYKPWHSDSVIYKEYFWKYARKTEFYSYIKNIKDNYTEEERFIEKESTKKLTELARKEAECVGDDRRKKMEDVIKKSEERLAIIEKIKQYELEGRFDEDVEDDPPTIPLSPEGIDYLRKKTRSKVKNMFANKIADMFINELIRENKLIIKKVNGLENLIKVNSGAVITCNHFNQYDNFAVQKTFEMTGKNKKLYKVIREGNYTNAPIYGYFFRNTNTLPLSSNPATMRKFMKAVDIILKRGNFILIYPEESLWWNYEKPKPLKDGAYRFAVRNNVPVVPIFITMEDSEFIGDDGFPIKEYTINIGEAIYPKEKLSLKENSKIMKDKNFDVWKKIYEEFYNKPLEYTTKKEI